MNIILIGYRGTGKTVVGKTLAERLGRAFFDADVFLEDKLERAINDMVEKEGWPFFRAREKEILRELSVEKECVIATGGGAVMDKDNVTSLAKSGRFILLKADIPTMVQRIRGDSLSSQQRPDLLGGDIFEETKTIIKQRMPVYEEVADFSVNTTDLSVDQVVEEIVHHLDL